MEFKLNKKVVTKYPDGWFLDKVFSIKGSNGTFYWKYMRYDKYRNEYLSTIPLIYKEDEIGIIIPKNFLDKNLHKLSSWTHHSHIVYNMTKGAWILMETGS